MAHKNKYLRHPRTTQERRMNFAEETDQKNNEYGYDQNYCNRKQLVRFKRQNLNLVDAYDDIPHSYEKSWKKRRKQRYYNTEEKTKCYVETLSYSDMLKLLWYCQDHHIRYKYYKENGDLYKFFWWFSKDIGVNFILKGV